MIDLNFEHEKKISSQDLYNIVSNAIDVANDDGMLNSFIFQRALYVFAAAVVYEEQTENIMTKISNFPELWDELVENNTIDNLKNDYAQEVTMLSSIGKDWFEEYNEHIHSSYAVVTAVSDIIQNFTANFQNQVNDLSKNKVFSDLVKTASQWGMNNDNPAEKAKQDSLFEVVK